MRQKIVWCALLFVVAVLVFVVLTVVPQLTRTLMELGTVIPNFFRGLVKNLEALAIQYPEWKDVLATLEEISIDWNSVITYATGVLKKLIKAKVGEKNE